MKIPSLLYDACLGFRGSQTEEVKAALRIPLEERGQWIAAVWGNNLFSRARQLEFPGETT